MEEKTITIFGRQETQDRGGRGFRDWSYRQAQVPVARIKSELADFLANMQEILDDLPKQMTDYELESMDVSVEISAKGNINLMAVGGEFGGTGGLTLHLRKREKISTPTSEDK